MMKRKGSLGRIITNAEIFDYRRLFCLKKSMLRIKSMCFSVSLLWFCFCFQWPGGSSRAQEERRGVQTHGAYLDHTYTHMIYV